MSGLEMRGATHRIKRGIHFLLGLDSHSTRFGSTATEAVSSPQTHKYAASRSVICCPWRCFCWWGRPINIYASQPACKRVGSIASPFTKIKCTMPPLLHRFQKLRTLCLPQRTRLQKVALPKQQTIQNRPRSKYPRHEIKRLSSTDGFDASMRKALAQGHCSLPRNAPTLSPSIVEPFLH